MADDALRTDLFIGGRWQPAESGERFDVVDPGTEEVVASVADAGASDARAAASAALLGGQAPEGTGFFDWPRPSKPGWSASTRASCPIRPHPSVA